jgi:hypothetical protein
MLRYNKAVYFKPEALKSLKTFTLQLNNLQWNYSRHCLDNIKFRVIDIKGLLLFIKGLKLSASDIFEYYIDDINKNIIKACYRIPYLGNDIIIVLGDKKQIITIYLNDKNDNHITLKKGIYCND